MRFSKLLVLVICFCVVGLQSCKDEQIDITQNTTEDLRGTIVEVETLKTYSMEQVDSLLSAEGLNALGIDVKNGIELVKITYRTINFNGKLEYATGAFAIPTIANDDPAISIATYCHGTVLQESNIPSAESQEVLIGIIFASEGIAVPMPDYLGFGPSPGLHNYVISKTEASATIDMMRASMNYLGNNNIPFKNEHFIFGYSQGGHAAMATVKAIEEMEDSDLNVIAAAPMSGPYDLTGTQSLTFTEDIPYVAPYYLPYILLAYNETYELYENYSDFLVAPYDSLLPPLFDGTHSPAEVDEVMPEIPNEIIQPNILQSFIDNPNDPFRTALAENNLHDWSPKTDMILFYCNGDSYVLPQNSTVACENFEANGATGDIECFNGGGFDHGDCVIPSLLGARAWFFELTE